ncbi:hypothetical protein [Methylobacterium sp. Leaf113]|uniref:hypothetical protein n=1 Tax=Methylobacterium sp. Leaf113 TaxID=1736259 RepID=UPI00138F44BA|nr:hypothetical protein [Methylobacterium sp. Leaf113]
MLALALGVTPVMAVEEPASRDRFPAPIPAPLDLDAMIATRDRPLFVPGRHPPRPPTQLSAAPPITVPIVARPPPGAVVTGIILGPSIRMATLKLTSTGKNVALEEGGTLEGWTLQEISAHTVVFVQDDRVLKLALKRRGPERGGN